MRRTATQTFCAIALVAAVAGCSSGSGDATPAAVTAEIGVATVTSGPMRRELPAYGTVEYAPDSQRTIAARAEVTVEQVLVRAGDAVTVGQPLMRVRGTPAALLELQKARTDLSAATQELTRTQRLFAQHLATNADMTTARQNIANARATASSSTARLGADGGTTLTADANASVLSVDAAQGDTIAAGAALLHLASGNRFYVRVGIEPADVALLRVGQPAELLSSYAGATPVAGTVSSVSSRIDPQLRLAQALIAPTGSAALMPNAEMHVRITVEQRDAVLGVPRAAVLHDGEKFHVFTITDSKAKQVEVITGLDDGQRIEIVSGLKAGDRVAVEGNHELEDGMAVKIASASANGAATDSGAKKDSIVAAPVTSTDGQPGQ